MKHVERSHYTLKEKIKIHKKVIKKRAFDVTFDGALESAPMDALTDLRKDPQEPTIKLESKGNIVNILDFHPFNDTSH